MTGILLSLFFTVGKCRGLQRDLRLRCVNVGLCSNFKVRLFVFCSSLRLGSSTKRLALLRIAVVRELCGPEAQDREDKRCDKHHGDQVSQSHNNGIAETAVGRFHVRGYGDNGAKAEAQGTQDLVPCSVPYARVGYS